MRKLFFIILLLPQICFSQTQSESNLIKIEKEKSEQGVWKIFTTEDELDRVEVSIGHTQYKIGKLYPQKNFLYFSISEKELSNYFSDSITESLWDNIKVVAFNKSQIPLAKGNSLLENEDRKNQDNSSPSFYGLFIGVNDYNSDGIENLKYANKDAKDLSEVIKLCALNTYEKDKIHITVLTTDSIHKDPTVGNIKEAMKEIRINVNSKDVIMIFFSGHGDIDPKKTQGKFELLCAGSTFDEYDGINKDTLMRWLGPKRKEINCILIFDACHSGGFIEDIYSSNGGKGMQSSSAIRFEQINQELKELKQKYGMFILASSDSKQKSYENPNIKQGLLTYSLLKAIKDRDVSDINYSSNDKKLNVKSWFRQANVELNKIAILLKHKHEGNIQSACQIADGDIYIGEITKDIKSNIKIPDRYSYPIISEIRMTDLDDKLKEDTEVLAWKIRELLEKTGNKKIIFDPQSRKESLESESYIIIGNYVEKNEKIHVEIYLRYGKDMKQIKLENNGVVKKNSIDNLPAKLLDKITREIEYLEKEKKTKQN